MNGELSLGMTVLIADGKTLTGVYSLTLSLQKGKRFTAITSAVPGGTLRWFVNRVCTHAEGGLELHLEPQLEDSTDELA